VQEKSSDKVPTVAKHKTMPLVSRMLSVTQGMQFHPTVSRPSEYIPTQDAALVPRYCESAEEYGYKDAYVFDRETSNLNAVRKALRGYASTAKYGEAQVPPRAERKGSSAILNCRCIPV
jgi:hypothetical protein